MSEPRNEETSEARSIAFECDLPEPPEKVWRALTTAEIVSDWLLPTDLVPQPGAEFTFRDEAAATTIECEVLSIEPERSISFGWRDAEARRDGLASTVTFEIAATGNGTHLRIVHAVRLAVQPTLAAMTMSHVMAVAAANDNCMPIRLVA
jgi:uncharacterized protein YndB with AHSA1/START domain